MNRCDVRDLHVAKRPLNESEMSNFKKNAIVHYERVVAPLGLQANERLRSQMFLRQHVPQDRFQKLGQKVLLY